MAIGHAVVYYDQAAQAFGAGIKCRHCTSIIGNGGNSHDFQKVVKNLRVYLDINVRRGNLNKCVFCME